MNNLKYANSKLGEMRVRAGEFLMHFRKAVAGALITGIKSANKTTTGKVFEFVIWKLMHGN